MIFPEIFNTGVLPENYTKESLISDGLCGWACCIVGVKLPENFGEGMAAISTILGTATPDGLNKLADKYLAEKKDKS